MERKLLTLKEASVYLGGYSVRSIQRKLTNLEWEYHKIGRNTYLSKEYLDTLIDRGRVKAIGR